MLPDPAPAAGPEQRPAWDVEPVLVVPTRVRVLGSAIGLAVGAVVTVSTLAVELITGWMPLPPTLALPVVLTGAISGWFMADAGWTMRPGGGTGVVIRMALVAVIVGDAIVVLTVVGGPGGGGNGGLVLMLIGLVLFGWVATPFTGAAALMWVAVMSFARRRLLGDHGGRA